MRTPYVPLFALLLACNGSSGDDTDATTSTSPTTTTEPTTSDVPTSAGGPLCGNGMVDADEDCDGTDLDGKTCADIGGEIPDGTLACAPNCTFNAAGCGGGPAGFVALNEVTSRGADLGPYAGLGDAVELFNPGSAPVDISGWMLSDDDTFPTDKTYVFPAGTTIEPGAYVVLTTFDDVTMLGDFPFGISDSAEESINLADAGGAQVDQVIFPGIQAAISYCRLPDGEGAWQQCDSTLGGANIAASMVCGNGTREGDELCEGADLGGATCEGLGFSGGTLACTAGCAYETGMCTNVSAVILNELESEIDQIEVFNSGDVPVDISGWILTDENVDENYDPDMDTEKLVFPPDSPPLGPGIYLVVAKGDLPGQHPFGLSGDGETVSLLNAEFALVDRVTYGSNLAAVSYCRIPDGPGTPWQADCIPTFGSSNMAP